jgi:hypothetical protein
MTNEATAMGGYLGTLTQVEDPLIPFLKYANILTYKSSIRKSSAVLLYNTTSLI